MKNIKQKLWLDSLVLLYKVEKEAYNFKHEVQAITILFFFLFREYDTINITFL